MGTVETRSKAPSEGSCSVEQAKPQGSEYEKKELNEALREGENVPFGVSVKGSKENDLKFPVNGDGGLVDDGVVEVVKSRFVETTVSVQGDFGGGGEIGISGPNDCKVLTDSEMNGVSSLLELRESERKLTLSHFSEKRAKSEDEDERQDAKIVTENIPILETSESKDVETEDVSDEEHKYSVGDFVWGKIKSHPWWPGRIYDPSDASDYALKLKTKDRVLVAYFGDGTFAWCHPSQLRPFEENFDEMVKQSSSKAFINAVQEAVNEVGRLLDLKMSCSCAAMGKKTKLVRPLVKNSGIKEGIYVPKTGIEKLSTVLSDPAELLSKVKQIAETITIPSVLEVGILKARLSAFCLSRGGYKLPTYHEPQPVPGLEDGLVDKSKDASNGGGEVEAPVQGPLDEEYFSPPITPKSGEISNPLGIFGRKQKSIAEIMGEDSDIRAKNKERDANEDVKDMDYPIVSFGRKKRKRSEETMSSKPVEKRTPRLAKNDESGGKENSENLSMSRERKKSKYLSPPFTTPSMGQRKRDMEEDSLEVSNEARLADRELSDISNLQTQEEDENRKGIDLLKIQVPAGEVLSEIHSAAISPQILREINSLERSVGFMSVYRSSMYREGSYYKAYNKPKRGRKRKKSESEPVSLKKDQNHDHDSEKKKRRTKNKSSDTIEPDTKVGKKAKKGTVELASAAALFVYFGPGSSLPSKSDLITCYGKFGVLNEEETDIFRTNYTARVCFQRTSDAEKALNHSKNESPFGSNSVKFRLQYINSSAEKSKSKPSTANPSATKLPGNEKFKLNFIKQKLESLNSLIEASDGKSPDAKTRLETELKVLLEDVNKMVESSSSS